MEREGATGFCNGSCNRKLPREDVRAVGLGVLKLTTGKQKEVMTEGENGMARCNRILQQELQW